MSAILFRSLCMKRQFLLIHALCGLALNGITSGIFLTPLLPAHFTNIFLSQSKFDGNFTVL